MKNYSITLAEIIENHYQNWFLNKVLLLGKPLHCLDIFENIAFTWSIYISSKFEQSRDLNVYYYKSNEDFESITNFDLIIWHEIVDNKYKRLLSYNWRLISTNEDNDIISVYEKGWVDHQFFMKFYEIFKDLDSFDKALSLAMKWENLGKVPSKFDLLRTYNQLLRSALIDQDDRLEQILKRKRVRSLSWISAITILTKPFKCPWKCIFCPNDTKMPKSYIRQEAACQRSLRFNFDPYDQVIDRLNALREWWHSTEKIELIILWWTFPSYPRSYQRKFIDQALKALNWIDKNADIHSNELDVQNEKAYHKMVWLSVEIRPDTSDLDTLYFLRSLWVTRIEMWVQSLDEDVLSFNKRWHSVRDIKKATRNLRLLGFKIMFHMMIWLPKSNKKIDIQSFKELFTGKTYHPDQLKIYPCIIVKWTQLHRIYKEIGYIPYNSNDIVDVVSSIKSDIIPEHVRIARITRDLPSTEIIEWSKVSNIREKILKKLESEWIKCKCIRCKEIKAWIPEGCNVYASKIELDIWVEYFISAKSNQWALLWICRLFLPDIDYQNELKNSDRLKWLYKSALIRELHVFWQSASITYKQKFSQHKWIWAILLEKAEKIASESSFDIVSVISAIWTRWYYRRFWYQLENTYMTKNLSDY